MTARDDWEALRRLTTARIALGRAGASLPTQAWLEFRLAHARARDAVWRPLDVERLERDLRAAGLKPLIAESAAPDALAFLSRPDLGRSLKAGEGERLAQAASGWARQGIGLVISGGLSAVAVENHGAATAEALARELAARGLTLLPPVIVRHGRVAVGDPVGEALGASAMIVLVGERPGLDSPDSLGAYLTFAPKPGTPDSARNCVSNIHTRGLAPAAAAAKLAWLAGEALRRRLSGVGLKDESGSLLPGQ